MESSYPPIEVLRESLETSGRNLLWRTRPVEHFKSVRAQSIFNSKFPGKIAGTPLTPLRFYRQVWISFLGIRHQVLEHVAIWALHYGEYPDCDIDHIDGNGLNNNIDNLKLATHSENMHNKGKYKTNKSGHSGIHWYKKYCKWVATGTHDGAKKTIGYYESLEDAVQARKDWEVGKGFSQRHGK